MRPAGHVIASYVSEATTIRTKLISVEGMLVKGKEKEVEKGTPHQEKIGLRAKTLGGSLSSLIFLIGWALASKGAEMTTWGCTQRQA